MCLIDAHLEAHQIVIQGFVERLGRGVSLPHSVQMPGNAPKRVPLSPGFPLAGMVARAARAFETVCPAPEDADVVGHLCVERSGWVGGCKSGVGCELLILHTTLSSFSGNDSRHIQPGACTIGGCKDESATPATDAGGISVQRTREQSRCHKGFMREAQRAI
jgi:hypothetical protein